MKSAKITMFGVLFTFVAQAHALPVCEPEPGSMFSTVYNLFDSAVTGSQKLKAVSGCEDLNIIKDEYYTLTAATNKFRIYDIDSFFSPNPNAIIDISVPGEGDYVTSDTCSDPMISSSELQTRDLNVFLNKQGFIEINSLTENCSFKVCPKYGACI